MLMYHQHKSWTLFFRWCCLQSWSLGRKDGRETDKKSHPVCIASLFNEFKGKRRNYQFPNPSRRASSLNRHDFDWFEPALFTEPIPNFQFGIFPSSHHSRKVTERFYWSNNRLHTTHQRREKKYQRQALLDFDISPRFDLFQNRNFNILSPPGTENRRTVEKSRHLFSCYRFSPPSRCCCCKPQKVKLGRVPYPNNYIDVCNILSSALHAIIVFSTARSGVENQASRSHMAPNDDKRFQSLLKRFLNNTVIGNEYLIRWNRIVKVFWGFLSQV